MKPDPTRVTGTRFGSYDKLIDAGFAPEETELTNGDIIISKLSPIQPIGNSNKIFKDSSEFYKGNESATVDKVWSGIFNHEGYEMIKLRTRSERRPRIGDKYCCFCPLHDILTDNGWINIAELKNHPDAKVACLKNNNELTYCRPTEYQEYDIDDELYVVDSNQVSLAVTKNHRMYVGNRDKNYDIKLAEDIFGKVVHYKKNVSIWKPDSEMIEFILPAYKNNPARVLDLNAWIQFTGIWLAEGSITNRTIQIAACKQRVKDVLDKICPILGFEIHKYKYRPSDEIADSWNICDVQVINYMEEYHEIAINKFIPNFCWNLNMEQSQLLIKSMCLGDGHQMKGTLTFRYDTSSIKLADDFQRLCLHAGWSANKTLKYAKGHSVTKKDGYVITSNEDAWRLTIITAQNEPKVNKNIKEGKQLDSYQQYKGKVYCCTVPDDGIIYVRKNGLPVWSGNSRHG
jgi:hypothetical protein